VTQYDPDARTVRPAAGPVVTETIETVVVRESNTGWWIAGILGGGVLIAVLWILFARGPAPATDDALLEAQADAVAAQAATDRAAIAGQVANAQASVDIARADAARAAAEARTAEAQAADPVVIERTVPASGATPPAAPVVSPTAPQN
jgi:hypothetical protein